jgi:hypothetical protein
MARCLCVRPIEQTSALGLGYDLSTVVVLSTTNDFPAQLKERNIMSTPIQIATTDGETNSQSPKSWFKTFARLYQNETDERRDITESQVCF